MLQQTQTDRVLPKYLAWFARLPDVESAARSSLAEILELWSGLGYNRRALALSRAAGQIVARGSFPADEAGLLSLPGVGPYTARAVLAFAFDLPSVFIETNIRSVFLHRFFPDEAAVPDSRIASLVEATLDRTDPRRWYYALMDYGVALKRRVGNPNRRSAHYARQSAFANSNRRIRGLILREVGSRLPTEPMERGELLRRLPFSAERIESALSELVAEGFVAYAGERLLISGGAGGEAEGSSGA